MLMVSLGSRNVGIELLLPAAEPVNEEPNEGNPYQAANNYTRNCSPAESSSAVAPVVARTQRIIPNLCAIEYIVGVDEYDPGLTLGADRSGELSGSTHVDLAIAGTGRGTLEVSFDGVVASRST
jgi:hypothetical protein